MHNNASNNDCNTTQPDGVRDATETIESSHFLSDEAEETEKEGLIVVPNAVLPEARNRACLERRVDRLERQVAALQHQLQVERQRNLIDPLTGIPNRRALRMHLDNEMARSRRSGAPLSLIVWDIDHFKSINDTHGHQFGDEVISRVAQAIRFHLRDSDFSARYGGEEFVSLLPDCDSVSAKHLAEKIRGMIQRVGCEQLSRNAKLSISCGIAAFEPGDDADSLFKRADKALYSAKEQGRDRVVLGAAMALD